MSNVRCEFQLSIFQSIVDGILASPENGHFLTSLFLLLLDSDVAPPVHKQCGGAFPFLFISSTSTWGKYSFSWREKIALSPSGLIPESPYCKNEKLELPRILVAVAYVSYHFSLRALKREHHHSTKNLGRQTQLTDMQSLSVMSPPHGAASLCPSWADRSMKWVRHTVQLPVAELEFPSHDLENSKPWSHLPSWQMWFFLVQAGLR